MRLAKKQVSILCLHTYIMDINTTAHDLLFRVLLKKTSFDIFVCVSAILGCETNNKYEIRNSLGQRVYTAKEGNSFAHSVLRICLSGERDVAPW